MDQKTVIILTLLAFTLICAGFAYCFALVIRYLLALRRLVQDLRKHEHALWISLGEPDFWNPFGMVKTLRWLLGGSQGITSKVVCDSGDKARQALRRGLIAMIIYFLLFTLIFLGLVAIAPARGRAPRQTNPQSHFINGNRSAAVSAGPAAALPNPKQFTNVLRLTLRAQPRSDVYELSSQAVVWKCTA